MPTVMKTHKATHLLAPAAVMVVVLLMVVPLPPLLLDLLLSIDIGLAVVLLLTTIYVRQPVEFSVFPSLLLLLTLIRLSLNVASTRLVLMHGQDGDRCDQMTRGRWCRFRFGHITTSTA